MASRATLYDAVVLGLGGMGSAALAQLALRGKRVLGVEQFGRGHDRGSSAGDSRIIRQAYFEDAQYIPLLRRAYELWHEAEERSGARLLDLCGVLMVGDAESRMLAGAAASAAQHGIAIEELNAPAVRARYPALEVRAGERVVFEPLAGMVFPEAAIDAQLRIATAAGAQTCFDTGVRSFAAHPSHIELVRADGSVLRTERLAICAGPWSARLLADLDLPLRVQRNVQVWFDPAGAAYARDAFPAFFLDRHELPAALYGFPDYGVGVKAALHGYGATADPDTLDRDVHAADIAAVKKALDGFMPDAAVTFRRGKACMYTLTPDEHFIIDTHPGDERVVIAGGFSGHGFKFCSVIGEIVADIALTGRTRHPIEFLRLGRFGATAKAP